MIHFDSIFSFDLRNKSPAFRIQLYFGIHITHAVQKCEQLINRCRQVGLAVFFFPFSFINDVPNLKSSNWWLKYEKCAFVSNRFKPKLHLYYEGFLIMSVFITDSFFHLIRSVNFWASNGKIILTYCFTRKRIRRTDKKEKKTKNCEKKWSSISRQLVGECANFFTFRWRNRKSIQQHVASVNMSSTYYFYLLFDALNFNENLLMLIIKSTF